MQLLALCDGGNWIDPLLEKHFGSLVRIIDWCHASEHLWDCAKAAYGTGTVAAAQHAERWEAWLWDGKVPKVIAVLQEGSAREAQVVFAVTTPCLHEPHWLAKKVLQGEPASQQVSADSGRPAPSFEEMA